MLRGANNQDRPQDRVRRTRSGGYLLITGGGRQGESIAVSASTFTIGRSATNHLTLESDAQASRRHALITRSEEGMYTIVDNSSRNGVFVNDKRVDNCTATRSSSRDQL
jgi:pSer/pThr/pTyr-binding forkhead associated (FHA) protein